MLNRDRYLLRLSRAFLALLGKVDAILGRAPVGEIAATELLELQTQRIIAARRAIAEGNEPPTPMFVVVDVRSEAERSVSMIPDAVTKDDFEQKRITARGQTVIPYCTAGGRSFLYARKLARRHIKTRNFTAGIHGWCNANLPLVTPSGKLTNRVHINNTIFPVPKQYVPVQM